MFRFGMGEIAVILLIALVLFGAGRLPEIARSLARSIKEFRKVGQDIKDDIEDATEDKKK